MYCLYDYLIYVTLMFTSEYAYNTIMIYFLNHVSELFTLGIGGNMQKGMNVIIHEPGNFPLADTHGVAVAAGTNTLIAIDKYHVSRPFDIW